MVLNTNELSMSQFLPRDCNPIIDVTQEGKKREIHHLPWCMSSVAEGIAWVWCTRPWAAKILTGIVAETTMNSLDYGWCNKNEFKLYSLRMFVTLST